MSLDERIARASERLTEGVAAHAPAAFASSFGAEDMVLLDLIERLGLEVEVFTLDTGRLHEETLDLIARCGERYRRPIRIMVPDAARSRPSSGASGSTRSTTASMRKQCCEIRKVQPLRRALAGKASGSPDCAATSRSRVPPSRCSARRAPNGLMKLNPLADWDDDDVWAYLKRFDVPVNALHERGFPSIGCAPCTRAVQPGEDPRAGRWWWEQADTRECGLHVDPVGGWFALAPAPPDQPANPRTSPMTLLTEIARRAAFAARGWTHLDALEAESIFILREIAAQCGNVALLFSGGKDSAVVLRLAERAFFPERIPFTLLHVDTEHNFPEVIEFRDRIVRERGLNLVVRSVGDSIRTGRVRLRHPDEPRNPHQSVTLLDAIAEFGFDACIGGARRDEEKARAKERMFSFRDEFGQWDPRNQRPELWSLYNGARPPRRKHPRLSDLELDRARRLAIHPPRRASSCRRSTSRTRARSCAAAARWCR